MRPIRFSLFALALLACDPGPSPVLMDSGPGGRDSGGGTIECPPTQQLCNGRCIPTATNPLHCGSCGNVCDADQTCEDGTCRGAVECPTGQRDCGGGCTDVTANPMHCGRCGEECAEGDSCIAGGCVPDECPSEQPDRCEDRCTDSQTDASNCGACGTKCAVDQTCEAGTCTSGCGGTTCEVDGADVCVDTDTDAMHCGGCGMPCDPGESCSSGSCDCPSGTTACGDRCVDTDTDPANCGSCGEACDAESACVSGACECPSGLTECDGDCVNTQIDEAHCGGCGLPCDAGDTCEAGACEEACGTGLTECGASCVDTGIDAMHCGACGNACPTGRSCGGGVCRPANDQRTNAIALTFPATGEELEVPGTTEGATPDLPTLSCSANGPNVWYRVTVPGAGGVLWIDTAGSDYDTAVFVVDASGEQVANMCNDDCGCEGEGDFGFLDSCTARHVDGGEYFISVGGYSVDETGDFVLHVQLLADDDFGFPYPVRLNDSGTTFRTFLLDGGGVQPSCGGPTTAMTGEDMRWFAACGGSAVHQLSVCPQDGGLWTRSGTRAGDEGELYDPVMSVISAETGDEVACNDDGAFSVNCSPEGGGPNFGARVRDLTGRRGIHAIVVDSRGGDGGGMEYRMRYQLPALDL